jgi:hypothetical protein
MLSRANAGAAAELKVTATSSNGIVLWIPAKPPVKMGSGNPKYDREPTGVIPLKREIVVALGTVAKDNMAYP